MGCGLLIHACFPKDPQSELGQVFLVGLTSLTGKNWTHCSQEWRNGWPHRAQ